MYDNRYIAEKLTCAMHELATGHGDARSRVGEAYYKFWLIKANDFPEPLREAREEIDKLLTRLPGRDGYLIADNLRQMKNKTASRIAYMIMDLFMGITELETIRKHARRESTDV